MFHGRRRHTQRQIVSGGQRRQKRGKKNWPQQPILIKCRIPTLYLWVIYPDNFQNCLESNDDMPREQKMIQTIPVPAQELKDLWAVYFVASMRTKQMCHDTKIEQEGDNYSDFEEGRWEALILLSLENYVGSGSKQAFVEILIHMQGDTTSIAVWD